MTHTFGPWRAHGAVVKTVDDAHPRTAAQTHDADTAALIAAAPDLLAALRGMVLCADARGDAEPLDAYQTRAAMLPQQIARARAAIARATKGGA